MATATPAEKIDVPAPERYTVLLAPDGKSRMACPPNTLDGPFMRDLQRVASFFIGNGRLFPELPCDSGTMKFRPVP